MVIFVGNLSRSVSEDKLRAAFEPFGEIKSVRVIKDRMTGQSRGFAFVDMPNQTEAQAAMDALNNTEVEGRQIRLNEARQQEERAPRSFGDGERRSSFGGGNGGGGYRPRRSGGSNGGGYSSNNRF